MSREREMSEGVGLEPGEDGSVGYEERHGMGRKWGVCIGGVF